MAKHAGGIERTGWGLAAVIGAVLLLVAGVGGIAWAVHSRGDSTTAGKSPSTSVSSSSSTSSPDTSTTGASPSTSEASGDDAAQTALDACVSEVAAGRSLASAASNSARDWGTHTSAETETDAGKITFAQAEALWAKSKANAKTDLAAFAKASAAYDKVKGACGSVTAKTEGSTLATKGTACAKRGAALQKVAKAGTKVNDQWAAHVVMMGNKAHMDTKSYRSMWLGMVRDAKPALAAYKSAAAGLKTAPACG